jgi:hypothetical protein
MSTTSYLSSAVERVMKFQEVIVRAIEGRYQAAEILGISDRQKRRWKHRYDQKMKKKSGISVDNVPHYLAKNSFLSVYRKFQINERKKSGNSSYFLGVISWGVGSM